MATQVSNLGRSNNPESQDQGKQPIIIKSAQQYIDEVVAHSASSITHSLYPGQNYEPLAAFLQPLRPGSSQNEISGSPADPTPFASLHDLTLDERNPLRIQHFTTVSEFERACDDKRNISDEKPGQALLLFLRGYPSPAWLSSIGWKCDVDPEFFLRHLDFRSTATGEGNYFTLPALPSTSTNIIRLRIPTVGYRQSDGRDDQAEVEKLRQKVGEEMGAYLSKLKHNVDVKVSDSIARSFAVYDQRNYTVEQDISICVNDFGKGWIGIAWLDNGYQLVRGPKGPWSQSVMQSHSWKTSFNPIVLHRPKIALKTYYMAPRAGPTPQNHPDRFLQSACQLPTHFGRFLHPSTATVDPFYALGEVFTIVASSESQYLNMVEQKIKSEIEQVMRANKQEESEEAEEQSSAISNLVYYKTILDEHIQRLKDNVSSIQDYGNPRWPKASIPKQQERVSKSSKSLLKDFEYLLERAKTLSSSCDRGVDIAGNNAMIAESRRAIQQAKRTLKLTLLAFFYIPASFTTSFFGMNLKQFGQTGAVSIWVWVLVLLPTYAMSLTLLYYDVSDILKFLSKMRLVKRHCG